MRRSIALIIALTFIGACSSTHDGASAKADSKSQAAAAKPGTPAGTDPSWIAVDQSTIPAAVRRKETVIDQSSVIIADDCEIAVSKNYQFDVSLIGDVVSQDLDPRGGVLRIAKGKATAFVRNLQVRTDGTIKVSIADVGTEPFIRVTAKGHCAHIKSAAPGAKGDVARAQSIVIKDERIQYLDGPSMISASVAGSAVSSTPR
jgi:hypothetical protein